MRFFRGRSRCVGERLDGNTESGTKTNSLPMHPHPGFRFPIRRSAPAHTARHTFSIPELRFRCHPEFSTILPVAFLFVILILSKLIRSVSSVSKIKQTDPKICISPHLFQSIDASVPLSASNSLYTNFIFQKRKPVGSHRLNSTPFVRQYGILLTNGVLFYAKRSAEQEVYWGIQTGSR